MYIKTINIESEHYRIIVWHNDPIYVDRRKLYGVIYWLSFYTATPRVDGVHPGLNRGCSQEFFYVGAVIDTGCQTDHPVYSLLPILVLEGLLLQLLFCLHLALVPTLGKFP